MPSMHEVMVQTSGTPIVQWLHGVLVCLTRGVQSTDEFTARRNDRIHNAIGQEFGLEVKITMRDFLLPVASVVIDGLEIEPRTGDRITEGSEVFEIQPPDDRKPSVELPAGGYDWLVHTKRIQ